MSESWRSIPDFVGYEVSDRGNVRRVRNDGVVVALSLTRRGRYLAASLRQRMFAVHALVLTAFVGPRPNGMQCRHLNGDPMDNRLENLAWGTPRENNADKWRHGTMPTGKRAKLNAATGDRNGSRLYPERLKRGDLHHSKTKPWTVRRGEHHPRAKLSDADVARIKAARADGVKLRALASEFGVTMAAISYASRHRASEEA